VIVPVTIDLIVAALMFIALMVIALMVVAVLIGPHRMMIVWSLLRADQGGRHACHGDDR